MFDAFLQICMINYTILHLFLFLLIEYLVNYYGSHCWPILKDNYFTWCYIYLIVGLNAFLSALLTILFHWCNTPYFSLRQLKHHCFIILIIQCFAFVWSQLDWVRHLICVHIDIFMCYMILLLMLYAHDNDCLNMKNKIRCFGTWILVQVMLWMCNRCKAWCK